MLTLDTLAHTSTGLLLEHVKRNARCLRVKMEGHSPLESAPMLKQLVRALSLGDAVVNLLVAVDHFRDLHREVIFVLDIGAHSH